MTYLCGPSVLHLPGLTDPIQPGQTFAYDFSDETAAFGPSQEAVLIACGALSRVTADHAPVAASTGTVPAAGAVSDAHAAVTE